MCAFFTVLGTCFLSDRIQKRGVLMLAGVTTAIAGYIMLIATPDTWTQYGGTFLVASDIFPCSPLVMGWLANNLAPHYIRATETRFQIMIAHFAAFLATFTYIKSDAYVTCAKFCSQIKLTMVQAEIYYRSCDQYRCPWTCLGDGYDADLLQQLGEQEEGSRRAG
jgi:hypothetical protein